MLVSAAALALTLLPGHIELDFPAVRYPNNPGEVNKNCPCGAGSGGQYCQAGTVSDASRSENVTALHAGDPLTVQFRETIDHAGRFRVAFDDDGADLFDFNANILADVADPADGGGSRTIDVTVPNVTCDNCTLQLIQDMSGNTADPVADPTGDRTYFTCADITIDGGTGTAQHGDPADLGKGCGETPSSTWPMAALLALGLLRRYARRL